MDAGGRRRWACDLCTLGLYRSFQWSLHQSLAANPDGSRAQLLYGNYTVKPQCVFEATPVPGSHKLVFTASAHHSITGGSLALLDTTLGNEFERPLTRLTPEVPFPETEAWAESYYASPAPLSEDFFLVSWADQKMPPHALMPPDDPRNPRNAQGIYLYDAFGNLTLLHRDPEISSTEPLPLRPRLRPPQLPDYADWDGAQEGQFLLQDVYRGLDGIQRGAIQRLRIIGVPPKVQPHMNTPVWAYRPKIRASLSWGRCRWKATARRTSPFHRGCRSFSKRLTSGVTRSRPCVR